MGSGYRVLQTLHSLLQILESARRVCQDAKQPIGAGGNAYGTQTGLIRAQVLYQALAQPLRREAKQPVGAGGSAYGTQTASWFQGYRVFAKPRPTSRRLLC